MWLVPWLALPSRARSDPAKLLWGELGLCWLSSVMSWLPDSFPDGSMIRQPAWRLLEGAALLGYRELLLPRACEQLCPLWHSTAHTWHSSPERGHRLFSPSFLERLDGLLAFVPRLALGREGVERSAVWL